MCRARALVALTSLAAALATPLFAADAGKTLRVVMPVAETGFDPPATGDIYSNHINRAMFDALYTYHHLARPYKLVPNTAVALPDISPDGLVWTIKVKPGIYFADDPAFKGRRRELTAEDYVYSWKRVLDPKMRAPGLQTFDGKFAGADALVARAKETGKFDYDAVLPGLRAIDRYTIRLTLNYPSYDLLSDLTSVTACAVAREVIEAHADESGRVMAHPVGTGPYVLKDWRRGQRIVLEANPNYRDVYFPESSDPADREIVAQMKGKKLPVIGRIAISIIEEGNPRMLAFEKGELDYAQVPPELIANVIDPGNKLKPRYAKAGVIHARGIQPAISYTFFNMEDPVVGGYTKDKVALRRAISMAYNTEEEIRVLWIGQAEPATQPIPPGVTGYDPKLKGHVKFDREGAKALLDKFGYVDRNGDGWRDLPDGRPLTLAMGSPPDARGRLYEEMWQRSLNAVGIRVEFVKQKFPDLVKMARLGQLQIWYLGNINTTTEGYGFLGLLYGGHSGLSNLARFNLPEYNRLYDASRSLPDSPERSKLFRDMSELVTAYAPWMLEVYRYENVLVYPWVIGYKYNAIYQHPWQYFDIDTTRKRESIAEMGNPAVSFRGALATRNLLVRTSGRRATADSSRRPE